MDYTMNVLVIITLIHINLALGIYIKKTIFKGLKKTFIKVVQELND